MAYVLHLHDVNILQFAIRFEHGSATATHYWTGLDRTKLDWTGQDWTGLD